MSRLLHLTYILLLSIVPRALVNGAGLPHVDDCFMCYKCHTGKPPGRQLLARSLGDVDAQEQKEGHMMQQQDHMQQRMSHGSDGGVAEGREYGASAVRGLLNFGHAVFATASRDTSKSYVPADFKFSIMPTAAEVKGKAAKRNCTECYGCSTQIEPLKGGMTKIMGQNMQIEVGASPEWLFFADLPDTATTGRKAVLKVWCMPIDKVHKTFSWTCKNRGEGAEAVQFLVAQQKVIEECGLLDVTIKVWPGRVNAVVPGTGLHVWWDGLWMEKAEGLSLSQLSYKRNKAFITGTLTKLLDEKLNKTRIIRAAIYDLLTSQCDRHSQNVFLDADGNIKLIDNLQALQFSWYHCAMDSIFLPGTQKWATVRWGGNAVFKRPKARVRKSTNPMVLFDYRCYTKDGRIGKDFDPTLRQCLAKLSKMTAEQVQKEYGFPDLGQAEALQQRASDMHKHGFEWALRYGMPQNYKAKTIRPLEPCCKLKVDKNYAFNCGHEWNTTLYLPYGDPFTGRDWKMDYPDPGVYQGGTFEGPPFKEDT